MSKCKCSCDHIDEIVVEDKRDVRIVILQRGWIFVGVYNYNAVSQECTITSGFNIRVWGTTKGLGELYNGPLKDTKLDPVPTTIFHRLTEVANLKVNATAWKLK